MFENFNDVMTIKELQEALCIGRSTAYALIKNHTIPFVRVGKSIRILKKNVIDYLTMDDYNCNCINGCAGEKGAHQ